MKRILLGKTGLEVNRLGLGGIPIQRVDENRAVETILHAVESGVDFIDTGRGYTTSEQKIGKALKETNRKVVLASKSHDKTSQGIRKDLEKSLTALKRDYIDLYQCHLVKNNDEYEQVISKGGAFEGLSKAREEGLIGHIGITSHSLDLFERVLDDGFFDTIMVCYSFLEPAAEEKIIPRAIDKGVGVITMKPFSGGVLEDARLALKYLLSRDGFVVIPGVEEKKLFDENWEIFQGSHDLDEKERAEIEAIRDRYDKIFCRRCDYCQPCSEDIPIQIVLSMRALVKKSGLGLFEREPFRVAFEKAGECSECGECMTRCPYELPIPDLIKENYKWLKEQLDATGKTSDR